MLTTYEHKQVAVHHNFGNQCFRHHLITPIMSYTVLDTSGLVTSAPWTNIGVHDRSKVTRLEVSVWEVQTLFKEGSPQGTPTAEDDPQG